MKKIIFSGIQPSGALHLGNYLGAIKQWVELQDKVDPSHLNRAEASEAIYCIVDLHAITVPQNPEELKENILSIAAWYIAFGIDPKKSKIFVQSSRPEHTELAWILSCYTKMGELSRMTQYKEKSSKNPEGVSAGLFNYPVLMAADILLYNATAVPVGEDQKQHVELARNIAERFNFKYGPTFVIPEPIIQKETRRIMSLDNPLKKMSKSDKSGIGLLDSAEEIRDKIKKAVTDSGSEIKSGPGKPALTNLISIFSAVSGKSIKNIEDIYQGKGYGQFKSDLAEEIITFFKPIQEKHKKLMSDKKKLTSILKKGAQDLEKPAQEMMREVKEKIGLGI